MLKSIYKTKQNQLRLNRGGLCFFYKKKKKLENLKKFK